MGAGKNTGIGADALLAAAADYADGRGLLSRARVDEERAKSGRLAVVASLFLALVAAALLAGGHAAIDPLLKAAVAAREARGVGDIVYTMPDGIFCRHMSFDNTTAEIVESAVERCRTDIVARDRNRNLRAFSWRAQ